MHKNDQVKFWQTVGDILGSKNDQQIGKVFRHGTEDLCSEEESVNIINEFFANIGEKVMENYLRLNIDNWIQLGKLKKDASN